MLKYDLQYFGGRGSAGARGGGGSTATRTVEITDEDWMNWAEDPEPFQEALNGTLLPNISQADGHHYTKEEKKRFREVAPEIQRRAESTVVDEHTLFRGESYDSILEARRKYKIGKTITNDKLTSYATNSDIANEYAGANLEFSGKTVKVVITNTNINPKVNGSVGVKTDPLGVGGSNEVITPKGMKSKVVGTYFDKESSTLFVNMQNKATPKSKGTGKKK